MKTKAKLRTATTTGFRNIKIDGTISWLRRGQRNFPIQDDHKPYQRTIRIDGKLPVGAYLLEARAVHFQSRDLVLVTDASLVLKSSPKQALVYFRQRHDWRANRERKHRALGKLLPKQQMALAQAATNNEQRWPRDFCSEESTDGDANLFVSAAEQ